MSLSLSEKVRHLPKESGVYFFKNRKGEILYVGKAKNLKRRVASYFNKTQVLRTKALVAEIFDFTIMIVKTEVDALLLERNLIKFHKPPYNVLLRDDKEYPMIKVNFTEKWPRVQKVRKRVDDGSEYFGPYVYISQLNKVLDTVMNTFPLVRCSQYEFDNAKRPCNYYHMKKCLAPCSLKVDHEVYLDMVKSALQVIKGQNKEVIDLLGKKMSIAAQNLNYELAAQLRDQISSLKSFQKNQEVVLRDVKNVDVIGFYEKQDYIAFQILFIRNYQLMGQEHMSFSDMIEDKEDALSTFLMQFYENREFPEKIVLPFKVKNLQQIVEALGSKKSIFSYGTKKEEKQLGKIALRNATFLLDEHIRKNILSNITLQSIKKLVGLSTLPIWIECIDISHIQGTATVGSVVAFKNIKPEKTLYRRFNLHDEAIRSDDYACIEEVVTRRLKRVIEEQMTPDLIIIDGGRGQLNAALKALEKFPQLKMQFVSLAKSRLVKDKSSDLGQMQYSMERVFLPDKSKPISLDVGSDVYRFFTQIRDEAHRFAITHHRARRSRIRHRSHLEKVKGIGPKMRQKLFEQFNDIEGLKKCSIEELAKVKGLSRTTAEELYSFLKSL